MTEEQDIAPAVRDGWAAGWVALIRAVKEAIGPDKLIFANVNELKTEMVTDVLRYADGIFLEDLFGALATDLEKSRQLA